VVVTVVVVVVVVVLAGGPGGGGGGGGGSGGGDEQPVGAALPRRWARDFFVLKNVLCRGPDGALGISLPRVGPVALSTDLFAGPTVSSALCRELPLGRGCAERIPACAESNSLSTKPWIPVVNCGDSTLQMQETKASFICASNASKEFPNPRQHGSEDIKYIVRSDRKILHWSQITIHLNLLLFFVFIQNVCI
jgi:hypothetical protein